MIIEYGPFMRYLLKNINPRVPTVIKSQVEIIDLFEFAQSVQINLPPPRIEAYMNSNYDIIQQNVIHFAGGVLYRLGFNSLGTDLPILTQLRQTRFFSLFLGLILNLIIGILLFLSVLLIYSLLMINVETRTFELGVLRMIGTTRPGIVILLLVQAFAYALPSWILGLIAAQLVSFGVTSKIYALTGVPIEAALTWTGILSASAMGILIPVLAAILPIRNALGMNLHDSLDTKHNKTKAVQIDVERAEQGGNVSWTIVVIGFGLAAFGGIIYYVLPLSLLSFNLGLLLNMFMFILGGMLLGLTMLALNLQHMLEHMVVYLFLWWDKRAIRSLVLKNLTAHRARNQKTTVMYAISLGFIIFISVAYTVQVGTFSYQQQQRTGCYLQVRGGDYDVYTKTWRSLRTVRDFEDLMRQENTTVKSHAWVTYELREAIAESRDTRLTNLGHLYDANQRIFGVSPNIFQAAIQGFLRVQSSIYDGDNNYVENDLTSLLYTSDGSKQALLGSLYKVRVGLELNKPFLFSLRYNDNGTRPGVEINRIMAPMAFLDAAPAFAYSQFPTIGTQDYVVSIPTYLRMSAGVFQSIEELPLKFLMVELQDGLTDKQIDEIKSKLTDLSRYANPGSTVWDYRDSMKPFNTATIAMQYFFNFTTVIAMAISFFSLMSSMFTNVFEQTKEIGVLRAIGISKGWMYRIYIYEAFVLVLSSSLLGVLIGTVVAFTMTLQQSLFTQLPVPFDFPYTILLVVFGCSILFSVLAAFSPIRSVLNQRIVQIFRILN
jgi:ABC-type antimicrobial peptide transport system permease subunit